LDVQRLAKAGICSVRAKPLLVILRAGDLQPQLYLYVSNSFLLQSGLLASQWDLAWTFDFKTTHIQPSAPCSRLDNSDCMNRSYVIFPGIDIGHGSPPQSAWTFFKPPHLWVEL
jgi:hypothetical protein